MLPKHAVLYYTDGAGSAFCNAVAQYAGVEVIDRIHETNPKTSLEMLRYMLPAWSGGPLRSIVFPYFIIMESEDILSDGIKSAALFNDLGVVIACDTIGKLIKPSAEDRFFDRRVEENFTIISLAAISLRVSIQHRDNSRRDDKGDWYKRIYEAMVSIIENAKAPIKHQGIADIINEKYEYYLGTPSDQIRKMPKVHLSTISDVLEELDKREEWSEIKRQAKARWGMTAS